MRRRLRASVVLLLALGIVPSWAQSGPADGADEYPVVDQGDPEARSEYDSAFSGYRGFDADPDAEDWRAANDEVGRLGGAMGHMHPMNAEMPEPSEGAR